MITEEQFLEWKTHPVTIEIYKEIEKARQELLNNFSKGLTLGHTADTTHGLTHRLVGQIEGLDQLLGISYLDNKPTKEEE